MCLCHSPCCAYLPLAPDRIVPLPLPIPSQINETYAIMMSPDLDLEQQQLQNLHRSIHLSATGEYEDDCSAISFITALVSRKRHDRVKLNSPFTIMFLAIMSLAVVLSYNAVIGQLDFPVGRRQFNAPSSRQLEATRSHDQQIEDRVRWYEVTCMIVSQALDSDLIYFVIYFISSYPYTRSWQ